MKRKKIKGKPMGGVDPNFGGIFQQFWPIWRRPGWLFWDACGSIDQCVWCSSNHGHWIDVVGRVAWSMEVHDKPLILAFGLISVAMWQVSALRVWWSSGHVEYLIILQEKIERHMGDLRIEPRSQGLPTMLSTNWAALSLCNNNG